MVFKGYPIIILFMRAFIFSLDAFVAFSLALIAIYSLIFFSSIPSSYYFLLTQGHYLSRDALMTLTTSMCGIEISGCGPGTEASSILDNIVSMEANQASQRTLLIRSTVGEMIPTQFGYSFEISDTQGSSWQKIYDTSDPVQASGDNHAKSGKKMAVSSQVITFGYSGPLIKSPESVYHYNSCDGGSNFDGGIITCGDGGNTDPRTRYGADLVPQSTAQIVRLTVFI